MKNAKKIVAIALSLIMVITGVIPAYAQDNANGSIKDQGVFGKYEDNLSWTLDDNGTLVIDGEGEMDYDRSKTEVPWSKYKELIQKVEIKKGVNDIMSKAFEGCINLSNLILTDSIKSIDSFAFKDCKKLSEINLPQSIIVVGDGAFENCTGLTKVRIPDNVSYVDAYTFSGCVGLKEVKIPKVENEKPRKFWISKENGEYKTYILGSQYEAKVDNQYKFDLSIKNELKVINQSDSIKISWETVPEADNYSIYRYTLNNGKYGPREDLDVCDYKCNSYVDKKVKKGAIYRYRVSVNKYVFYGDDVYRKFVGGAKSALPCCRLIKPENVKVKAAKGINKVSWTKVKQAAGYEIYRKISNKQNYEKIARIKGNVYTDKKVKKGKIYQYKVRAYYKHSKTGTYSYSPYSKVVKSSVKK